MAILFAVVMIASALVVMSSTIFISGAFADNSSSPNEVPDDYISPSDTVSHDGITFTSKADQDPVLKWPFYGAETTDHTITFGWYNIEGAQKYLLQVDNNPDFSSPEIETYVVEAQFKPEEPLADDTYYWRVKTIYETGEESMWSDVWKITMFTAVLRSAGSGPVLKWPFYGAETTDHTITFGWYNIEGAQKYLLQVDNNPDFSSPEIETYVVEAQFKPEEPLADDTYYWRVKTIYETGEESMWSDASKFMVFSTKEGITADLGIAPIQQHKDTRMLCLDGCAQTGAHAWDVDHVTRGCAHDDHYCARARASMLVSYYGGSLSQDRISYQMFGGGDPEDDLGHGQDTTFDHTRDALTWAFNGAAITYSYAKPEFNEIRGWIDAGRPVGSGIPGHAVVIDGYNTAGELIHVIDPWTGTESSIAWATFGFTWAQVPPAGAAARSDEASLTQDSDSDGIVDFDEINRFGTNPNNEDSDGDGIPDKIEIQSYTFVAGRIADVDGDGLRAERDIDTDNGGVHDGYEDLNKNGVVDPGETDPFNKDDDQRGLDLIFTIDTTGSMWDDIANVKASATEIVNAIDASIPNYRIAVVDYRDFPVSPYGDPGDYQFNDQLSFSTDKPTIIAGIQGLTLGSGADWRESVYSALMHSIDATSLGGWRGDDCAMKAIILMGDAPPHDPEPFTGYTLSSVITAAELADPVICYPIQIGGTVEKFAEIASGTGGEDFTAETADEVVDAILEAIETITTKPVADPNGPYTGTEGVPITFDGSGSYDPDGTIVSYDWDFDDGGTGTGENPTHTYAGARTYTVTLTVTDNDALTDTKTTIAKIAEVTEVPDLVIEKKWLCWPDNCTICYNVTNIGDGTAPAGHNTTLYVDGVAVAHDHVPMDLATGESYIGCFDGYTWTYTPPSDNITVCADNNETLVELDETNNCLTNIWMCGDVNGDHTVNVIDVVLIYKRALDPGYPLDLPWAGDVNCDRNINVIDVVLVYKRALDPGYDLNCC